MSEVVVRGSAPVRAGTIYALGRNYAEHAREMGAPAEPVVFLMPASALAFAPAPGAAVEIAWPEGSAEVHHEVELVLLLGAGGTGLTRAEGEAAIAAVGLGIDLTARDLQAHAKAKGQPWARSKGFPGAAPVSEFVPRDALRLPWGGIDLSLAVGGALRQSDRAASMLLDPPAIVAQLSRWFALEPGDLVFTGTPAGVGPIGPGEEAVARSAALGLELRVRMATR
ncbi:MAG: fumarylacetoacetate hydrolase family protein [Acidobacteria bacterium]|jgi:2-keto-4-pentenoate hydratase/2-oxohepta-3-ene-1,7-dioic acid hydratase in catechol pathway|nr:fumarylacetoacetate hydrolase family protein [Acidobacteriota bacterium]